MPQATSSASGDGCSADCLSDETCGNGIVDTVVGEDGLRLSGGERRRLAIARAMLKDAPVVVLDEATADLDSTTEAALWSAMDPWLQGRTALVISHRSTIGDHVDRVVELGAAAPRA